MSELGLKLIAQNKVKYALGEDARVLDLGRSGSSSRTLLSCAESRFFYVKMVKYEPFQKFFC
jgi:hypothetical protein